MDTAETQPLVDMATAPGSRGNSFFNRVNFMIDLRIWIIILCMCMFSVLLVIAGRRV